MQNYIELNNKILIPQLGFGVFRMTQGDQTYDAVRAALDAGYRHIDTATAYDNEKSVGRAIKDSGIDRKEIFVTTKCKNPDTRARIATKAFETSLENLGLDYLDLYLIHWPTDHFEQAWLEMEDLYLNTDKVRAIGVSNFYAHHLNALDDKVLPAVNQIESNPYYLGQEYIDESLKRHIDVEIYSPLGGSKPEFNVLKDTTLANLAEKYGKSPAQIVIRWHLQRGLIVLPKSTHKERIEANFDVFDFTLTGEDMALIESLDLNRRSGHHPDEIDF